MERNRRSVFQGVVTSVKMDKTIVVTVSTKRNDPLYQKRVGYSSKFYAHDEHNEAKLGDTVTIMGCRPLSKTKRFRLVSIDKKAVDIVTSEEAEKALETAEGSVEEIEKEKEPEAVAEEPAPEPEPVHEEPKSEEPAPEEKPEPVEEPVKEEAKPEEKPAEPEEKPVEAKEE